MKSDSKRFAAELALGGVSWILDRFLEPGEVRLDMGGIWHIGDGTDLEVLKYTMKLTPRDRRFLRSMRIDPEAKP